MSLKRLFLACSLVVASCTYAQEVDSTPVFKYVESMPTAMFNVSNYLSENLVYPRYARRKGITGKVIVKFIVDTNGAVDSAHIIQGIGGGCDEEALRVVQNMPPWKPGKQNGKKVKVYFTLPIHFQLTD